MRPVVRVVEEIFGIRRYQSGKWVLHHAQFNTRKEATNVVRSFDVRCPGCNCHAHFAKVIPVKTEWDDGRKPPKVS